MLAGGFHRTKVGRNPAASEIAAKFKPIGTCTLSRYGVVQRNSANLKQDIVRHASTHSLISVWSASTATRPLTHLMNHQTHSLKRGRTLRFYREQIAFHRRKDNSRRMFLDRIFSRQRFWRFDLSLEVLRIPVTCKY
jgi:hypothetical protein